MFGITRNIPVPGQLRREYVPRRKYPFEVMEVGDMFFVPYRTKNNLSTHVSNVSKALKRKYTTRMTYMRELSPGEWEPVEKGEAGAVLGIGIWRVR